jgi:hypothetical protein
MSVEDWLRQSILNYFEYRRAENLLGFTLDEMGATPREVFVLSRDETVDRFRENPLAWTETQIIELLESALLRNPESSRGDLES